MRRNRKLLVVGAGFAACVIMVWFCTLSQGSEKKYEVRPYITVPEYRTDTARAIDAYERLMERFMTLAEKNLGRIDTDVQGITKQLNSINRKLTELSTRMARIEKALGIEQPKKAVKKRRAKTSYNINEPASEGRK